MKKIQDQEEDDKKDVKVKEKKTYTVVKGFVMPPGTEEKAEVSLELAKEEKEQTGKRKKKVKVKKSAQKSPEEQAKKNDASDNKAQS